MIQNRIIDIMKHISLLDWHSLLVGWQRGWAERDDIISHAVQWLTDHPDDDNIQVALMAGGECYGDDKLLEILEDYIGASVTEAVKNSAIDQWRLAHLLALSRSTLDTEAKLDRLQELYAEFAYPHDMEACSRYYQSPVEQQFKWNVGDRMFVCPYDAMRVVIDRLQLRFNVNYLPNT